VLFPLLRLKKVQILGFKSFCDRTEVQLSGEGIVAIVGPNGCGKSNISDAITWVLGEQSAKSLRGIKMEDVIFAGTRDRKPTGMAEVSLTLVDPEVYDNTAQEELEAHTYSDGIRQMPPTDWDETATRAEAAEETEEAVLDAQPGTTYEAAAPKKPVASADAPDLDAEASHADPNNVVLKIRRRKFGRAPIRAGEITVTRRLFRTGDSEYLLNGKICRLSDIKDIFMGTGLGGESYAMIGQERIGQILSSKPLDRRGIIEEAAGITRFKTKKRLAELRLESAKQNLSRVNDIFEEVTRQMAVLKRQASKAERYGALRDELRTKLRVVLASRLTQMDAEQAAAVIQIAHLSQLVDEQATALEAMDTEHSAGVARGYEFDGLIRESGQRANQSAVELERIAARTAANHDRVHDLTERITAGNEELSGARAQLASLSGELEQHRSFLENATAEAAGSRDDAAAQQAQAHEATRNVLSAEALAENQRRSAMQAMQRAASANNQIAQAEASLAALEQESNRLEAEATTARGELETVGVQRGQARMSFESVTDRLKRLESEILDLRQTLDRRRGEETQSRRRGDELRAQAASLNGKKSSLESLIREHSYSPDTVRDIFKSSEFKSEGILAKYLEVDGQYQSMLDEFLRDELNYIVVKSWNDADKGIRLLQAGVTGRATFLLHEEGNTHSVSPRIEPGHNVVALRDVVRVLNGFGDSLKTILPKLRNGFITPDTETARNLARQYPEAYFLSPTGESFHYLTLSGGKPRELGPLALKGELTALQTSLASVEAELAQNEMTTSAHAHEITSLMETVEARNQARRDAERESADSGAAVRQTESEAARIEARLQHGLVAAGRNKDQRIRHQNLIDENREQATSLDRERHHLEQQVAELTEKIASLRVNREELQLAASAAAAALAGLEERRRNASANFEQTRRLFETQSQRIAQVEQQLTSASDEKQRRETETATLQQSHTELTEMRAQAIAEGETLSSEASALRTAMTELDTKLRALRHNTESLREQRATLTARSAKLTSDLEYLEATCVNDLSVEPSALREDATIVRIEAEALHEEDEAAKTLKQRLEGMGPVNMMALEEYTETAERHTFLDTQRQDLLDSIENTQASIKEIDDVSREKFDEAYKVINENFSTTFTKLFGGGQAHMKLTDELNSSDSGIDIIASPPGKKLQNVLLLSGGEKALTALSLLVGIFQFQPAPFCVLDEVDAPLDETNVGRFARLVAEMSNTTQFIVITHSKRTMEQADVMYGVTMQEPGVSKIVSVSLGGRSRGREARTAA
jgi:chromosome segregation protein